MSSLSPLASRFYEFPTTLNPLIEACLREHSPSLRDPKLIAKSVLQLSDFYAANPNAKTPWTEPWAVAAYIGYYFPLNLMRAKAVFHEAQRWDFFSGIENLIDYGSGLGSGSWLLAENLRLQTQFIEASPLAHQIHRQLLTSILGDKQTKHSEWLRQLPSGFQPEAKSLGLFSYSLTEISELPQWTSSLDRLMLIEPSTRDDGRKLLHIRQQLIAKGWSLVAPCTHQGACPLLSQSKSDWCHDRIHWRMPEWFVEMESHLPIKNSTLTYSYLLATRQPLAKKVLTPSVARIVGDRLPEKGKARQLICRGEQREFLAWLSRDGEFAEIPRGVLVEWPLEFEKKSNEIRLRQNPVII